MQYAAFLSTFALLWLAGFAPAPRVPGDRLVVANPSADQTRVATDVAAVDALRRFREAGTETARAAVVSAEQQGRVQRVWNGAPAVVVGQAGGAFLAVRMLEGELAGRLVYVARADTVR